MVTDLSPGGSSSQVKNARRQELQHKARVLECVSSEGASLVVTNTTTVSMILHDTQHAQG